MSAPVVDAYTFSPKTAREAAGQLVWPNRILANEGIFDYLGHVSVRNPENPETFLISRGIAPATVTEADICEIDREGTIVKEGGERGEALQRADHPRRHL